MMTLVAQTLSPEVRIESLPVWMTVQIGTFESTQAIQAALERKQIKICRPGQAILEYSKTNTTLQTVETVQITGDRLGLPPGLVRLEEVYSRAYGRFGLQLCPQELAPQTLLQSVYLRKNRSMIVAMTPVETNGESLVYVIGRGHTDCRLSGAKASLKSFISPDNLFLFTKSMTF